MAFTAAFREAAIAAAADTIVEISLHTGPAGTDGDNEAAGAPYERQSIAFTAGAVDGTVTGTTVTFDVPAGTFSEIGFWDDADAFVGSVPLASPVQFGQTSQVDITPTLRADNAEED